MTRRETVVLSGTGGSGTLTGSGDIVAVNVNVSANTNAPAPVTVTVRKGSVVGSGQVVWQGSVQNGIGNVAGSFGGQSIIVSDGLNVTVDGGSGATMTYQVYGFGFGVICCRTRPNHFGAKPGADG